jgi:hypothetical protein
MPEATDNRAAEALNSMDPEVLNAEGMAIDDAKTEGQGSKLSLEEGQREAQDLSKYLLGKSYFDCKEYARAAHVLKGCQSMKSKFLRSYSKYLVLSKCLFLTAGWREKERGRRRGGSGYVSTTGVIDSSRSLGYRTHVQSGGRGYNTRTREPSIFTIVRRIHIILVTSSMIKS